MKTEPSPKITAAPYIMGRPMTSTEIQKYLNRSPTKDERSRYSSWRNQNPNVDLDTGEIKKPEPDPDRFMPRSWRLMRDLEKLLPAQACELIEALIDEKINEEKSADIERRER